MARPPRKKCFADMLRIAVAEANLTGGTALRDVAQALVDKARSGDVPAIRELADRLDGKVAQAVVGDDEQDEIRMVNRIERIILDPVKPQPRG